MTPKKDPTFRIQPPRRTTKPKPSAFNAGVRLDAAESYARKHAPKPSSWWTKFASGSREAFVAEVNQRALDRDQKSGASTSGIGLHRLGPQ